MMTTSSRSREIRGWVVESILRSWFHLNYESNLQVERESRELKKDETERKDALQKLVLIVFLQKYSRFGSDG